MNTQIETVEEAYKKWEKENPFEVYIDDRESAWFNAIEWQKQQDEAKTQLLVDEVNDSKDKFCEIAAKYKELLNSYNELLKLHQEDLKEIGSIKRNWEMYKEQIILNIEDRAKVFEEKYCFQIPYDGTNEFYDKEKLKYAKEDFIAGANEMLPIIKELGEALKNAEDCVSELTALADGYENDFVEIQTTLDKYKQYL